MYRNVMFFRLIIIMFTGQTEPFIHRKDGIKDPLVLCVLHDPTQLEPVKLLHTSEPRFPTVGALADETMTMHHEFV